MFAIALTNPTIYIMKDWTISTITNKQFILVKLAILKTKNSTISSFLETMKSYAGAHT